MEPPSGDHRGGDPGSTSPHHRRRSLVDPVSPRPLEFLAGTNCHLYTGQLTPGGEYRQRFTGPGIEALLGGPLPAGADPAQAWVAAIHPDDQARYAHAGSHAEQLGPVSLEYRLIGYDTVIRWVLDRRCPWPKDSNGSTIYDGVVTDVTTLHHTIETLQQKLQAARATNRRLAQARAAAERRARTDELTGLFNRRHLTAMLPRYLSNAAAGNRGLGLLLIDIDFFKQINDDHGHIAGDQLLTAFAQRLRSASRTCDLTARWGGEEFVVLLPDVNQPRVVHHRAEQIRARVANQPFLIADNPVTIQVSIGAVFADASTTPDQLLEAADDAMYAAKRAGRNRVGLNPNPERPELTEVITPADPAAITTGRVGSTPAPDPTPASEHQASSKAC